MAEMRAVDLSRAEFAYLLAACSAPAIIGLESPSLFPDKPPAREKLYKEGRKVLESNGWLRAIPDQVDEYELDAELLQLVAVICSPTFVVASQSITGDKEQGMVHYLAGEEIAELSLPKRGTFRIAGVVDHDDLVDRIATLIKLPAKGASKRLELEAGIVKSMQAKGKQAADLEAAGIGKKDANALIQAVQSPTEGQVVLARTESGEVQAGRRVKCYGEGKTSWLSWRSAPEVDTIELMGGSKAALSELIDQLLDELSE
jgi:hypothetical protein